MTRIGWDDQGDSYTAWDRIRDERRAEREEAKPPYGPMCRNPRACAGKGHCPLDPTCGD